MFLLGCKIEGSIPIISPGLMYIDPWVHKKNLQYIQKSFYGCHMCMAPYGDTPLYVASQEGHVEIVKAPLAQPNINVNQARTI